MHIIFCEEVCVLEQSRRHFWNQHPNLSSKTKQKTNNNQVLNFIPSGEAQFDLIQFHFVDVALVFGHV